MDGHSYIMGFVQGLIACEMLVMIIKIGIDMKQTKSDMKELDKIGKDIERDLAFSTAVCDKLKEQDDRISKLENKYQKEDNVNE